MAAAVLAATVSAACATLRAPEAPAVTPAGVRFVLRHPQAQKVSLAGSFNQWSESSHPLARSSGVWTIVVALPPGEYAFMYVVDGREWLTPPAARDYVDDGFGSRNGVVVVRSTDR